MNNQWDELMKAANAVAHQLGRAPLGVVLGSGLSEALDTVAHSRFMSYSKIPGMPNTSIAGHRGALLHGLIGDVPVLAMCGRIHTYEGRPMSDVAAPVRLLSLLGVKALVITSAVGSIDPDLPPGHLMIVDDHINLAGTNVLAGHYDPRFGPQFPDLTRAYDRELSEIVESVATQAALPHGRGVLAHFRGPSYETPSEVIMAGTLGARVVSMSMVPEVLVARQRGMRVVGVATVTNLAAGVGDEELHHDDVLRHSARNAQTLQTLLAGALPRIAATLGIRS